MPKEKEIKIRKYGLQNKDDTPVCIGADYWVEARAEQGRI